MPSVRGHFSPYHVLKSDWTPSLTRVVFWEIELVTLFTMVMIKASDAF